MSNSIPVIDMKNMSMIFPGTKALDNVNFTINEGEVIGLVGENGAGKSTLMKILCGVHSQTHGDIYINGEKVKIHGTSHAQDLGITMIYQELSLFLDLNAVDNIFINREISKVKTLYSKLNKDEMKKKAKEILKNNLSVEIDLDCPVEKLRLADRQLIEIARALCSNSKVIIMDEPTEALEIAEQEQLFEIINDLKKAGKSIVYVSHQLEQLLNVSDRVVILRDGKNVGNLTAKDTDVNKIIDLMIGSQISKQYPEKNQEIGEVILKVENLFKKSFYNNISFELHRGEIIGLAGLAGAGKSELIRSIFGATKYDGGKIYISGNEVTIKEPIKAIKNKIAFLGADRKTESLFLNQDVEWNLSIAALDSVTNVKIDKNKATEITNKYIKEISIKTPSSTQEISGLSGGNQQKVLLARWLMNEPDIILVEEPTRGIDVKAKAEVYKLLAEFVKMGKGVIVLSSESPELIGICNKIIVMYDGKIAATLNGDATDEKEIAYYTVQDTIQDTLNEIGGEEYVVC